MTRARQNKQRYDGRALLGAGQQQRRAAVEIFIRILMILPE
jgi:hypothetical protein